MKKYTIDAIRNIALVGHGGTGKSSLAEAMLYTSGAISRLGRVDDGTSASDFDPEEIQRRMSINASVLPCEWKNTKINVIDTPGYLDFVGDVVGSLRAVEAALLVVDGSGSIEVGTETGWELAEEAGITRLFFVNKLEKENMDFGRTLESLRKRFGTAVAPLQLPIGSEDNFVGVVDLLTHKAYKWENGKIAPTEIPADMQDRISSMREELIDSVAGMDDALMAKYLEEGTPSHDEIAQRLHGQRLLLVSRGLAIAPLILQAFNYPFERVVSLIPENAASSILCWPPQTNGH